MKMSRGDCIFSFHRGGAKGAENLKFAFAGERPAKAKNSADVRHDMLCCRQGEQFFEPPPLTAAREKSPPSASSLPRAQRAVSRIIFQHVDRFLALALHQQMHEKGGGR
jgi:hypothetical protein